MCGGERLPGRRKGTIRVFPLLLSGNLSPKKFPGMTLKTEPFKKCPGMTLKKTEPFKMFPGMTLKTEPFKNLTEPINYVRRRKIAR